MSQDKTKIGFVRIIYSILYILVYPVLILLLSGDWLWLEGWIFDIWFLALCYSTIIYLYRNDPALLIERNRKVGSGNQKGWDKYVVIGIVIGFLSWMAIMPLDAKRFSWSPDFPYIIKIIGFIFLLLSSFLFFRSYKDNTYLSPLVRIQEERKQKAITTGVYSFVRHPMYLGASLMFIGTPFLLSSFYGIIVGLLMTFLLAGRIVGEEKMLTTELEGYYDYKKKVKYRLIPFVW
jgi:protein-S-isoprenylcysteine O-methyltransferase Ste14